MVLKAPEYRRKTDLVLSRACKNFFTPLPSNRRESASARDKRDRKKIVPSRSSSQWGLWINSSNEVMIIFWHFRAPEAKCRLVILEWREGRRLYSPDLQNSATYTKTIWLSLVLTLPSWVFGVGCSKWKYALWPSIGRPHLKLQNILINGTTAELAPDRCQLLRFFQHSPHDHASSAPLGRSVTYSFK